MAKKAGLSKKAIVYYVLAGIFLALTIAFIFDFAEDFLGTGINLKKVATGVILVVIGTYAIFPSITKRKDYFRWLFVLELIVLLIAGIAGFILPGISEDFGTSYMGPASLWIGLLLAIHAVIYLSIGKFSKPLSNWQFILYLIMLFVGGFIMGGSILDRFIEWFIVAAFAALTIYCLVYAVKQPRKKVGTKKEKEEA